MNFDPFSLDDALRNVESNGTMEGYRYNLIQSITMISTVAGQEKFVVNRQIMREGHHRHYTGHERKQHFGRNTFKTKEYYGK